MKDFLRKTVTVAFVAALLVACSHFNKNNDTDMGLIPFKLGDKWGYVNLKGEYVINPQFANADYFRDGLAMVQNMDEQYGYIDKKGTFQIAAQYKSATPFSDGLAFVVSEGGHPTCIDKSGAVKFTLEQAERVFPFSEGLALFCIGDAKMNYKYGYIDKSGKEVVKPQFDMASSFYEGLACIKQGDQYGFIDKTGKMVINPQFENALYFLEGLSPVCNGKQWGFIDAKGSYVIQPQFDDVLFMRSGMAPVKMGEKWGYINKEGKVVVSPQFDEARPFPKCGLARVQQYGKWGYINKKGDYAINPQFEDAVGFNECGFAMIKSGGKWGIVNSKGEYMVNPQFDELNIYDNYDAIWYPIRSDYYDITSFINAFFEKMDTNFMVNKTLRSVKNHPLFSWKNLEDYGYYYAEFSKQQKITDDITLSYARLSFEHPTRESVPQYSYDRWGYRRYEGTIRRYEGTMTQFNYSDIIETARYCLELSGKSELRSGSIMKALKLEIEKRFNVKMEKEGTMFYAIQNNDLGFSIDCYGKAIEIFISKDSEMIQRMLRNYGPVTETPIEVTEPVFTEEVFEAVEEPW